MGSSWAESNRTRRGVETSGGRSGPAGGLKRETGPGPRGDRAEGAEGSLSRQVVPPSRVRASRGKLRLVLCTWGGLASTQSRSGPWGGDGEAMRMAAGHEPGGKGTPGVWESRGRCKERKLLQQLGRRDQRAILHAPS